MPGWIQARVSGAASEVRIDCNILGDRIAHADRRRIFCSTPFLESLLLEEVSGTYPYLVYWKCYAQRIYEEAVLGITDTPTVSIGVARSAHRYAYGI